MAITQKDLGRLLYLAGLRVKDGKTYDLVFFIDDNTDLLISTLDKLKVEGYNTQDFENPDPSAYLYSPKHSSRSPS